jgi:hypothetical protein
MEISSLQHTLTTAFSMGMVVLLSPETFILGLLMAAHKTRARLNSVVFFLGSAIGLFLAIGLGLWITPTTTPGVEHASWLRFAVRAGLGSALLYLGIFRAWQYFTGKDDRVPKTKTPPPPWKAKLLSLLPSLNSESTFPINAYYLGSTFLIGLFTTGLHPKTSILAITMGHQITRASGDEAKIFGFALFSVLALLPVAFPLFLALFHPQAGPRMKEKCTALLEEHGRWVASIICIIFALLLWNDALKVMPR